ncbi:YceI family protein [Rhodocaloribacter litoris]|uniref:YceI family protein n=1 Tax=Rhodocaloribacter litoris TaxID=2558931 RepID=UPI00141F4E88|nr:YceI family protein [Rhodocaloribacter litoris]QXD16266.1 YceI family protein [Rhodocaloribacter litoris]
MSNRITYAIDPSHSRLGFTVRHMGFAKVRGAFEKFEGTISMEDDDLATLAAEVTIEAASINTHDNQRDEHLRSADFFDVEKYPQITFRSTGMKDVSGTSFTLVGALTIHGVTRTVEIEGALTGKGRDPWGNNRVGFEGRTTINRKDFGLTWNAVLETGGVLVSEDVQLELEVEAVEQVPETA